MQHSDGGNKCGLFCRRPLAKLVSRLAPTLAVASVNKNPLYPEVQRHFDEDPLNFRGNVRARAAAGGACKITCLSAWDAAAVHASLLAGKVGSDSTWSSQTLFDNTALHC